ncbi:hypothetical protein L484_007759 [Morus notabilis]|uniref:Uncharacterized protein n=1 Tax=Morus notabilis TaxID=981085 RepID=W9R9S9_9ROSA|nr:hypothetical protein L484_007759 [Morus notabilis]
MTRNIRTAREVEATKIGVKFVSSLLWIYRHVSLPRDLATTGAPTRCLVNRQFLLLLTTIFSSSFLRNHCDFSATTSSGSMIERA